MPNVEFVRADGICIAVLTLRAAEQVLDEARVIYERRFQGPGWAGRALVSPGYVSVQEIKAAFQKLGLAPPGPKDLTPLGAV